MKITGPNDPGVAESFDLMRYRLLRLVIVLVGFGATAATLPEFSFQRSDLLHTNEIHRFGAKYDLTLFLSPATQARLQEFSNTNLGKLVVMRFGPIAVRTNWWGIKQMPSRFNVSCDSRDEAIALACSLGLAHDWRLHFGQRWFGLLEMPRGTTALFAGKNGPLKTVSFPAVYCLAVFFLPVLLMALLTIYILRRKHST